MTNSADQRIAELERQLKEANQKIARLTAMLKLQQNQLFGEKTEVFEKIAQGQQSLFNVEELSQMQSREHEVTEVVTVERKQVVRHHKLKASGKRAAFLDSLPQVDQVIELNVEGSYKMGICQLVLMDISTSYENVGGVFLRK